MPVRWWWYRRGPPRWREKRRLLAKGCRGACSSGVVGICKKPRCGVVFRVDVHAVQAAVVGAAARRRVASSAAIVIAVMCGGGCRWRQRCCWSEAEGRRVGPSMSQRSGDASGWSVGRGPSTPLGKRRQRPTWGRTRAGREL